MRIYCPKSGVEWHVANLLPTPKGGKLATAFNNKVLLQAPHPIFAAPQKYLVSRARDWAEGKLDAVERRLLFLALLNSTGLIDWRDGVTATPKDSIVQQNMETLLRFIYTRHQASTNCNFPMFTISHATSHMDNVKIWLETWNDAWELSKTSYLAQQGKLKLQLKEEALEKLILSPYRDTESYASRLGDWVLEVTEVPRGDTYDTWLEIFKLRGNAIYSAKLVHVEELLEHMEEHLQANSIFAAKAFEYVRHLHHRVSRGMYHDLGITDEQLDNPYSIITEAVEQHNRNVAASVAPAVEPQLADFPNKLAYLRAKANWQLAQREAQKQQEAEAAAELKLSAVTDTARDAAEEAEFEDTGTILELRGYLRSGSGNATGE